MTDGKLIDHKLLTLPEVVLQNLNIGPSRPSTDLQELCRLPKVELENLNLNMAPSTSSGANARIGKVAVENFNLNMSTSLSPKPKIPKVQLEKLDIALPLNHTRQSDPTTMEGISNNLDNNYTKRPIVLLSRCKLTAPPTQRKVTINRSPSKVLVPPRKLPPLDLSSYTLVGPYRHVQVRQCEVKLKRDNLIHLKSLMKKPEKPTFCKLCGKLYLSKKKLNYHLENKHDLVPSLGPPVKKKRVSFSDTVIVHTMPYHRCRKCLKVFETYKILRAHMKSQHKKRTCYVCDYCDKLFADRTIFKIHIKLHCDSCSILFPDKKELIRHRKTVCLVRRIHRVKCASCGEQYFSNLALKDHSYSHVPEAKLVCDICKDYFSHRCPMIRHLHFSHSKSKQGTPYLVRKLGTMKLFTCTFCAETLNNEDHMMQHLLDDKSPPDIETVYGKFCCEYCPEDFVTQKEFLQHLWGHANRKKGKLSVNGSAAPVKQIKKNKRTTEADNAINGNCNGLARSMKTVRNNPVIDRYTDSRTVVKNKTEARINGKLSLEHASCHKTDAKRLRMRLMQHKCLTCRKTFTRKSSLTRHSKVHAQAAALQCSACEESFAWPALLHEHRCLRDASVAEVPFDDIRPEVPLVTPEYMQSSLLDVELPPMHDITSQVDFEIPAPPFEFAGLPEPAYASCHKYRFIRQEVPIEF